MRFVAYLSDSAVKGSAVQTIACDRKDILSCQNNTGRKRAFTLYGTRKYSFAKTGSGQTG
jgi:hypothetical protein